MYGTNSFDTGSMITATGANGLYGGYGASGGVVILEGFNIPAT